jgi:hypothetical protein
MLGRNKTLHNNVKILAVLKFTMARYDFKLRRKPIAGEYDFSGRS